MFLFYSDKVKMKRKAPSLWMELFFDAGATGLEPATYCVTGSRSNQLSYAPVCHLFSPLSNQLSQFFCSLLLSCFIKCYHCSIILCCKYIGLIFFCFLFYDFIQN